MVAGTWTAWFFFIVTKTAEDSLRDGHDKQLGQYLALFVSGLTRDPLANGLTNWPITYFAVVLVLDYGLRV